MEKLLLDGGSATELVRLGHANFDTHPLWSSKLLHTDPNAILTAHKNEQEAHRLMKRSVEIARQACVEVHKEKGTRLGKVAGSVGPYGIVLCNGSEYTGLYVDDISSQELQDWHKPKIQTLLEAAVDLLAIETIPAQKEAVAIVELLEKDFPSAKAWVTFSCKNNSDTCHGGKFCDAIQSVYQSRNVAAIGINCTDPQYVTPLLKSIQHLDIQKPIIVKPNSREQWKSGAGWYGTETCDSLCDMMTEWIENGATWIGGCCRVYPEDIAEMKEKLQGLTCRGNPEN